MAGEISVGRLVAHLEVDNADLKRGFSEARTETQALYEKLDRVNAQMSAMTREGAAATGSVRSMGAEMNQAGQSARSLAEGIQLTEDAHHRASAATGGHAQALGNLEGALTGALLKMSVFFAALQAGEAVVKATASAVAELTKNASAGEETFADLRTITGSSKAESALTDDQLRKLTFGGPGGGPGNLSVVGNIATQGAQIGVAQDQLASFTLTVERLTAITRQSGEATATWLGQLQNLTHVDVKDFDRLGDSLAALSNFGASTPQAIQEISLRLAGAGNVAGLSAPQILGWAAAASDAGINSEAAGTSISRTWLKINDAVQTGGHGLRDVARLVDMTSEEFTALYRSDPNKAFESVIDGLKRTKDEGGNVGAVLRSLGIVETEQVDALLRLSQAHNDVASHTDISSKAFEEGGLAAARAGERWTTTASQLKVLQNLITGEGATAASPLNDALGQLAKAAGDAVREDDELYKGLATRLVPVLAEAVKELTPVVVSLAHGLPDAISIALHLTVDFATALGTVVSWLQTMHREMEGINQMHFSPPVETMPGSRGLGQSTGDGSVGGLSPEQQAAIRAVLPTHNLYDGTRQVRPGQPGFIGPIALDPSTQAQSVRDAIDLAERQSRVGSAGATILGAADAARQSQDPEKLFADVQKLKDLLQKDLSPEQFAEMGNRLVELTTNYFRTGGEETRKALEDYLAVINSVVTVQVPADKKAAADAETARKKAASEAEAERKREAAAAKQQAEAAAREAARVAQLHADLVHDFSRVSSEGVLANTPEVGKAAAQVGQALSAAFEPNAGGSQGAALAKSVSDLINQAVKANVPEAKEAGERIKAAMLQAISTGSEADRAAALALSNQLGAQLKAASALTPENFARSFAASANRNTLGTEGASLIEGLKKSDLEGTPEALDQASDALARLQGQLYGNQNLTPEQVSSYWARIMGAVNDSIATGGEEARATLEDQLRKINIEQLLDTAGNALEERFKNSSEQASRQIKAAVDSADRTMTEASDALQQGIDRRQERENIRVTQTEELKGPTHDIETARINRGYLREEQETERQRMKQGADMERDYQRQLQDIRRQATGTYDGVGSASVGSQERLARARAEGLNVGPVDNTLQKQLAEAKRVHDQKLLDVKAQQDYEDNIRLLTRSVAASDRQQDEAWAQTLTNFKRDQAQGVIDWEDTLAQQQLAHKIGPGGPVLLERDARIQAIRDAYVVDEGKAEELFNKQLAQQLMLRNVAPGGAGEQATREMLTASFNNYRSMLGLPEMPSPFSAGNPAATTPTQTQVSSWPPPGSAAAAVQAARYDPAQAAMGVGVTVQFNGNVYGPGGLRTAAAIIHETILDASEQDTALGAQ